MPGSARLPRRKLSEKCIYTPAVGRPTRALFLGPPKSKNVRRTMGSLPLEEYRHYNSQKTGEPLFLIAPKGLGGRRALDSLHEGKRWGGQVYSVVSDEEAGLLSRSDQVFPMAEIPETLSAFTYTLPVQLLAYHVAMTKFHQAEVSMK